MQPGRIANLTNNASLPQVLLGSEQERLSCTCLAAISTRQRTITLSLMSAPDNAPYTRTYEGINHSGPWHENCTLCQPCYRSKPGDLQHRHGDQRPAGTSVRV